MAEWNPKKNRRKANWFFGGIVVLVALLTTGWFFIASKVDQIIETAITDVNDRGDTLACTGQEVVGFPFRMGLSCDTLSFADAAGDVSIKSGALRTAAQVYAPNHHIAELTAPLQVQLPGALPMEIKWESLLSSVRLSNNKPKRLKLDGKNLAAANELETEANLPIGQLGQIAFTAEAVPENFAAANFYEGTEPLRDLRVFTNASDIRIANIAIPALQLTAALRVNQGAILLAGEADPVTYLADNNGDLQISDMNLAMGETTIALSGTLSLSQLGLLNGELNVVLKNLEIGLETLESALRPRQPAQADAANTAGQILLNLGIPEKDDPDTRILPPIKVKNGKMTLGFIPLGTIPSLRQ